MILFQYPKTVPFGFAEESFRYRFEFNPCNKIQFLNGRNEKWFIYTGVNDETTNL